MAKPPTRITDAHPVDPADRGRVFTIHLAPPGDAALRGRVVHLASGEAAFFDAPSELISLLMDMAQRQG